MSKKGPDILVILSVLIGSIIVAGAVVYATLQAQQSAPQVPLTAYSEQVLVPETMQRCSESDQCIVVDTTCSFCCKYLAVNAAHEKLFNQMFDQSCAPYKGPMCECFDLSSYPKCVDGFCQLVKFDDDPDAINKPLPPATIESRQPVPYQFPPLQSLPQDTLPQDALPPPPPPPVNMPLEEPLPPGFFEP